MLGCPLGKSCLHCCPPSFVQVAQGRKVKTQVAVLGGTGGARLPVGVGAGRQSGKGPAKKRKAAAAAGAGAVGGGAAAAAGGKASKRGKK